MNHLEAHEAEFSVLGGIMLDNAAYDQVAAVISADDFHQPRHKAIFRRMASLSAGDEPIDPVTLATAFEKTGDLTAAGGLEFLLDLGCKAATAVNIGHHAGIVQEHAELRTLVDTCLEIANKARGGEYDSAAELFDSAQAAIFGIGKRRQAKTFDLLPSVMKGVLAKIQQAYEAKAEVTGLRTGFSDLDDLTSGLQPGDLIILAARPSMGKTALALNLAANAAKLAGQSVAVFSLEMPTAQLVGRLLSAEAQVEVGRMRSGYLEQGDIERILQANKRMAGWSILIDDTPGITVMEARTKCRRLAADKTLPPLGLVIVDYLQLMKGPANIRSREQEISDISRNLKSLAKELGVPVLALSQLNRGLESRSDKRPIMSDLRESGAIEQDADIVACIYRDEVYDEKSKDKGTAEVIIRKHRNGGLGTVRLKFEPKYTRFNNLDGSDS